MRRPSNNDENQTLRCYIIHEGKAASTLWNNHTLLGVISPGIQRSNFVIADEITVSQAI